MLLFLIVFGTLGYEAIEKEFDLLDSFYMSVITMSTTGFKEVYPLSAGGKIFTSFLIIAGVITFAYTGSKAAQIIIEKQVFRRRKMDKILGGMKNHYIICGYGRMGKHICDSLHESKTPFIVIENDHDQIDTLIEKQFPFIEGDATNDDIIIHAGIKRAKGFAAVIRTDAENVFATLSAKELNPAVYVVSRAIEEGTEQKLKKAGADRVVKPYELSSTRLVQLLLRPGVSDFIDVVSAKNNKEIHLEEINLCDCSELVGKKLMETTIKKELSIMVIAITREDGTLVYNPEASIKFESNDKIIVIGEEENLYRLNELCGND